MLVTKYIDKKSFDCIYPWGETLASIACYKKYYYHFTIGATPIQSIFGIDMIFNLTSFVYCLVITANKYQQVKIDNSRENTRQFIHNYVIGDLVYVYNTIIYHILDYKKYGPYIRT